MCRRELHLQIGGFTGANCEILYCGQHGSVSSESCVCTDGYTGTNCEVSSLATPLPAGFTEAVTLVGCADPAHCGTFHRVLTRCMFGGKCSTDLSMCNGVPAYQKGGGDGPVLLQLPGITLRQS